MKEVRDVTKPVVSTLGLDRNVYALIGRVSNALEDHHEFDRAQDFVNKSISLSGYDELVALCGEYVEFSDGGI